MIALVISEDKAFRKKTIATLLADHTGERIHFDDSQGSIHDLEQFVYPSLFETVAPVIHAQYILEDDQGTLSVELGKKLLASPTLFLFEEMSIPKALVTELKKKGALVHQNDIKIKRELQQDIFTIVNSILIGDKKSRWLAYHRALSTQSIEALMGMLYWKVRALSTAGSLDAQKKYMRLYRELLCAHAHAWQRGSSLADAVEKVILEYI